MLLLTLNSGCSVANRMTGVTLPEQISLKLIFNFYYCYIVLFWHASYYYYKISCKNTRRICSCKHLNASAERLICIKHFILEKGYDRHLFVSIIFTMKTVFFKWKLFKFTNVFFLYGWTWLSLLESFIELYISLIKRFIKTQIAVFTLSHWFKFIHSFTEKKEW